MSDDKTKNKAINPVEKYILKTHLTKSMSNIKSDMKVNKLLYALTLITILSMTLNIGITIGTMFK